MTACTKNSAWMYIGVVITLLAGTLAAADDTELLLLGPDPASNPKANVMFILDTSGSMDTVETTITPYDGNQTYSGGTCNSDRLYWTVVGVVPVCNGNETQFVEKAAFVCDSATQQLLGIGSATSTMAQFREKNGDGNNQWQELEPGNAVSLVECQADSGIHGDGDPAKVYAQSGSNPASPFTASANAETAWGSAPRNLSYTFYDGNYLNWQTTPVTVDLERLDIVKTVTKTVLNSVSNMNVGIMRFNNQDGGPVIQALTDLDTNRASIISAIDSLTHRGFTPLAETLYENALYWLGEPAYYGETINETATDPAALAQSSPEVYAQPSSDVCARNFNVLLTDGEPKNDSEAATRAPTLPNFNSVLGRSACTGTGQGACLDDISEYLGKVDTSATEGIQPVITHTIGFTIDLELLEDAATVSGGQYFLADDVESLTLALLQIIADINDLSLSFSAPAVAVNSFNRTQNFNDLYLTLFASRAKAHWPGNLKKYKIVNSAITDANGLGAVDPNTGFFLETARSFWSEVGEIDGNDVTLGGAARKIPDPSTRVLFTNNGSSDLTASGNDISTGNAGAFTLSDFGLTGTSTEPTKDEMIRWMRGEDIQDADDDAATTVRFDMGDPLHSQPAVVVYGGTSDEPNTVVFTATNDGYLHAFDGGTGEELWAFVPKQLLPNMARLFFDPNSQFKQYGLDGNIVPVVFDENKNGIIDGPNDFVRIVLGMRRGGSSYFALDVTNKNSPRLLWTASPPGQGQSWSTPVIARIDAPGVNSEKAVVVIGGGYDTVHDTITHPASDDGAGAALFFLDLETGNELWRAAKNAGGGGLSLNNDPNIMNRAIPGEVRVVDLSGDGLADRMYASDMGGQLWRFDIHNGEAIEELVTGGVIAQLGAEGLTTPTTADTRRFYTSPDVSLFTDTLLDRRFIAISIGSGYRSHPLDNSVSDRFYSVRDPRVFSTLSQNEYDSIPIVTDSDLVEISGQLQVELALGDPGWKFTLPDNQKVLSDSLTFDDKILFVGFSPDSSAAATCSTGNGTNVLYTVSVVNGDPVVENLDALTPGEADDARRSLLHQGGIAPTPSILFPGPNDATTCVGQECSPPPIACIGVECFDPGFNNNPVRTLWTQDGIR